MEAAVTTFLASLLGFLAQSAPFIILGYFVAALIKEFVPLEVFVRYFSGKGWRPLLRALGVGCMLPMCSCAVVPVGVGAFRCGASRGTTLSFICSGPMVSPVAVFLAFSYLVPTLVACFVVTALVGSLLIGVVGNRLLAGPDEDALRKRRVEGEEDAVIPASTNRTVPAKLRGAGKWAFWDLGTDISVDLLIGLSIASAIIALIPADLVSSWLGKQDFMTLLYVVAVGVPLFTCTVPSLAIVYSLLLLGMSPGAAVAYLISGPGTNLGDLNVIRRNLGLKTAALFAGGLVVVSIAGGLVTDHLVMPGYREAATVVPDAPVVTACCAAPVFGGTAGPPSLAQTFGNVPLWHWPFVAILGAALAIGLVRRSAWAVQKFRAKPAPAAPATDARAPAEPAPIREAEGVAP